MKVLVFGSCNIDIVYSMDAIVRPAETVSAKSCSTFPGGKGFNQTVALAKAGVPVCFAGCIGNDGLWLKKLLEENGADTSLLKTVGTQTGHAIIQVDSQGQNAIFVCRGANGEIRREDVDEVLSHFGSGDMIVLQNEISELFYIIEKASRKGMRIVLNPSPFDKAFLDLDLADISYLVVNETEACAFSGTDNPFDLVTGAKNKGLPTQILLTLGEKGSVWWDGKKMTRFGVFRTQVVDTTAAGDTFTGYFIAGLLKADPPEKILETASAASAAAISRPGASSSIPTPDEVRYAIKTLRRTDPLRDERKQKVIGYLKNDLQGANLFGLSRVLGFSEEYTGKWVSAAFGFGFTELLQEERITAAAALLRGSDILVEEVIAAVGYRNGSHFRKKFREKYGVSPLRYKKENKLC